MCYTWREIAQREGLAKKGRQYKEASTGIVSCAALSGWGTNAVLVLMFLTGLFCDSGQPMWPSQVQGSLAAGDYLDYY